MLCTMPPPTRALVLPLIALNMTGHASVVDAFTAGDLADHRFLPTAIALPPV